LIPMGMFTEADTVCLLSKCLGRELKAKEMPYVNRLMHLLGGLPQAIALAAPLIRDEGWEAALDSLQQQRLAMLERSAPETKEDSVRLAFQASYAHLTVSRQAHFRALGVLPPALPCFDRWLAAALWDLDEATATKELLALRDCNLIEQIGRGRYSIHTLLRCYAEEELNKKRCEQRKVEKRLIHYSGPQETPWSWWRPMVPQLPNTDVRPWKWRWWRERLPYFCPKHWCRMRKLMRAWNIVLDYETGGTFYKLYHYSYVFYRWRMLPFCFWAVFPVFVHSLIENDWIASYLATKGLLPLIVVVWTVTRAIRLAWLLLLVWWAAILFINWLRYTRWVAEVYIPERVPQAHRMQSASEGSNDD